MKKNKICLDLGAEAVAAAIFDSEMLCIAGNGLDPLIDRLPDCTENRIFSSVVRIWKTSDNLIYS